MRHVILSLIGLLASAVWLMLLEVSAFNVVVVGMGLLAALTLNPQARGAHR